MRSVRILRGLAISIIAFGVTSADAHQRQTPLELWGPFLPGSVTCLRALSRATQTCFESVLRLRQDCREALMDGKTCDVASVDEQVALEIAKIRTTVLQRCQLGQLTELYFPGGVLDAQADLSNTCRDQAEEMVAAIYAPEPTTADDAWCVKATAKYGRKVVRFVIRRKGRVMDRMADRVLAAPEKFHLMDGVVDRLDAGRSRWAAGLRRQCPNFEAFYGQTADAFIGALKDRADCVLSATHGNNSLICPQFCGNGIPEEGEECDDGNADDGDACTNECTFN